MTPRTPRSDIEAFPRPHRHGWPDRLADRLATPDLPTRDYLVRAGATTTHLVPVQLVAPHQAGNQRAARAAELLLGGPRSERARAVKAPNPGKAFPVGEIYLSMPRRGDLLAARDAREVRDHIHQFPPPDAVQYCAGTAPVT